MQVMKEIFGDEKFGSDSTNEDEKEQGRNREEEERRKKGEEETRKAEGVKGRNFWMR